ncbi:MAG: isopeptide-forming domain-containing fimbrial protein, partial [Sarcina sp.]
ENNVIKKENNNIKYENIVEAEIATTMRKTLIGKTVVNLEDTFRYTIDISFSNLSSSINSATIEDFIPDYINFTLPPIVPPLRNIRQQSVQQSGQDGTRIIFDFGGIPQSGVSTALNISCKFKLGTSSGERFTNTAILRIDSEPPQTVRAQTVTLQLTPDFELKKKISEPSSLGPAAGQILIYIVTLKNKLKNNREGNGDFGAKITNVRVTDTLPRGFTFDNSITPPIGIDTSGYDKRHDNLRGTINGNVIQFILPEYYGTEYKFIYVVRVPSNFPVGTRITNNVTWDDNTGPKTPTSSTTEVDNEQILLSLNKTGPTHATRGNRISYDISPRNASNIDLQNLQITDTIPPEVIVNRINSGRFCIFIGKYFHLDETIRIDYEINNNRNFVFLKEVNAGREEFINLPRIPANQKITKIRWT